MLAPGTRLDRYVILASLGEATCAARDPRDGRTVALKLILDADNARLVSEARAAAALRSPYVVPVHEVLVAGGVMILVMAAGETTLRAHLPSAATLERKVRWLCDLARGLAAIHAVGLVHRDVEPRHVRIGADGRARLDVGIALRGDVPHAGSPGYIAPEQLATGSADARCDQYAWAVTAYEVLVGGRPMGDRRRDVAAQAPQLPRALANLVGRALAIDPDARFPSMAALADALEPFAAPVVDDDLDAAATLQRPSYPTLPRHRSYLQLALTGALAAAVLVGLIAACT